MTSRCRILMLSVLGVCCCATAGAEVPCRIYLADARQLEGELVSISQDGVVLREMGEEMRVIDRKLVIALRPVEPAEIVMGRGMLVLTDQQQLAGELAAGGDESIIWRDSFLERSWQLDQIDVMWWGEKLAILSAEDEVVVDDLVVTRSGDLISGFVLSIDAAGVTIEIDERSRTIAMDQVVLIDLATEQVEVNGTHLLLSDGSRVEVSSLRAESSETTCVVANETVTVASGQLRGVVLRAESWMPLAMMRPLRVDAPADRRRSPAPQVLASGSSLGLEDVLIDGPVDVTFELPGGATAFSTELVLPDDCTRWGSYEVVMLVDGVQMYRGRFDRSHRHEDVRFDARGARLTLRIIDADNGSVQDRLLLREAFVVRDGPCVE
jgi:hypothetical protein